MSLSVIGAKKGGREMAPRVVIHMDVSAVTLTSKAHGYTNEMGINAYLSEVH